MKKKNFIFCLAVFTIILLVTAMLYFYINRHQGREKPSPLTGSDRPAVAITFDDGPDPVHTPRVLDILHRHNAPATFFLVGEKLSENRRLVKEISAGGHEIDNHTYSHRDLSVLDSRQISRETENMQRELQKILPGYEIKYFRPPYGRYTPHTEAAAGLDMALWTVDSGDWENPKADDIYRTATTGIKDSDVIIFHDDNRQTVSALDDILTNLEHQGFQFVTLSQLREREN